MAASIESIAADLRTLGVRLGDLVMIHASLRKIGPVDGGAEGLIAALDLAVGAEGTLMMVLGARDDWAWVNERPESERVALLADAEPFDPLATPAEPDVGVLAEVFRTRADTVVSDHPEARFAARGRLAAEIVADQPWDDCYGPGSPLETLIRSDGKVLRMGADPDTVTLFHHAEYLADVAGKRRVRRHRKVATPSGPRVLVVECLDDTDGIVDRPGEPDYFISILDAYLATGRVRSGIVGAARSELLDAADAAAFAADWMTESLGRPAGDTQH